MQLVKKLSVCLIIVFWMSCVSNSNTSSDLSQAFNVDNKITIESVVIENDGLILFNGTITNISDHEIVLNRLSFDQNRWFNFVDAIGGKGARKLLVEHQYDYSVQPSDLVYINSGETFEFTTQFDVIEHKELNIVVNEDYEIKFRKDRGVKLVVNYHLTDEEMDAMATLVQEDKYILPSFSNEFWVCLYSNQ